MCYVGFKGLVYYLVVSLALLKIIRQTDEKETTKQEDTDINKNIIRSSKPSPLYHKCIFGLAVVLTGSSPR